MKIFNWVQRRFNQGNLKDGLARNVKKVESLASNDIDKQALLKQVALVNVLDGWKDGILTIGTLGFDPMKPFTQQNEYFILESEEQQEEEEKEATQTAEKEEEKVQQFVDDDDVTDSDDNEDYDNAEEEEELNPLMSTTFEHIFEDSGHNFDEINAVNSDVIMTADDDDGVANDQRKKNTERVTLAELFLADSDYEIKKKPDSGGIEPNPGKKPVVRAKNSLSFAKKLIPHVREDLRPIKKLHQVMRKLLKKKIHPELEGYKGNVEDNLEKPDTTEGPRSKGNKSGELVSLLRTMPGLRWVDGKEAEAGLPSLSIDIGNLTCEIIYK